jgi:protein phosphatase
VSAAPLEAAPERLIDLANERGGDDNITVIVVHVG